MLPDFLTTRFITGVIREYPAQAFIGSEILPLEGVASMETVWDVIKKDAKLAPFVAMNAESPMAEKADFARVIQDLACIREKEMLNEDELLNIRELGSPDMIAEGGLEATRQAAALNYIRRTTDRMAARVTSRVEWMRWQAISVGAIAYDDNKVKFSVSTGIPDTHIVSKTGNAQWSDLANSDPIKDIATWMELVLKDTGRPVTRIYVGNNVPAYLAGNAKVRDLFKQNGVILSLVNPATVLETIGSIMGVKIQRYATFYQDGATDTNFLAADQVVLMCEPRQADGEVLGDMATGPAKANNYQTGLYGWVKEEEDPWATYVGAGIHAFPRIYHPNWIVTANVKGGAGT